MCYKRLKISKVVNTFGVWLDAEVDFISI